ncbi:MAG TPA: hypothetical protein VNI77_04275 [Nitrososphaera sp.]|nr:hypothetical protein [Nitrososphaera sp.]
MLWIAYEPPAMDACLAMHISRERTVFVCYTTIHQAVAGERYVRKPIFTHIHTYTHTDGARWYNGACSGWLRLRHYVYGTELKKKNLMERFILQVKDRTECFDDYYFPCRKKTDCSKQHVWNWLKLFLLYSHMGTDRRRFMSFLARGGG